MSEGVISLVSPMNDVPDEALTAKQLLVRLKNRKRKYQKLKSAHAKLLAAYTDVVEQRDLLLSKLAVAE